MPFDAHKNFAWTVVQSAPVQVDPQHRSLTVSTGGGTILPAAPCRLVVSAGAGWPDQSTATVIQVTAIVGDTITYQPGAEGTADLAIRVGWRVADALTAGQLRDVEAAAAAAQGSADGKVATVSAADGTVVVGGTATNPTVRVGAISKSQVTDLSNPLEYRGQWNAASNTPTLANGVGTPGDMWRVSVAGTADLGSGPLTCAAGDDLILSGTLVWQVEASGRALDSTVVHNTGAETIAGVKTFSAAPVFADQPGTRAALSLGSAATHATADFDAAGAAAAAQAASDPSGAAAAAQAAAVASSAQRAANLSDLANPATARTNLGAVASTDSRLSDQRVPLDGSVTAAKVDPSLKPSGTAAAGTEALRALGTTASTAAAGNDSRIVGAAADAGVVHLAGTETITGQKTLAVALVFGDQPGTRAALGLGSAATHPSTDFDPAGAAAAAQAAATSAAESYSDGQLATALAGLSPAEFPAVTQGSGLTHSGVGQTIGGVTVTAGMRVLDTAAGVSSGLWVAAAGPWTRPVDFASGSNAQGKLVDVDNGGLWLCVATSPVTVDTTSQVWAQIDASVVQAGSGLAKTGNTISLALTKALIVATGLAAADIGADASGAAAAAQAAAIAASAQRASNLADLASAAAARTNLGLGSAATQPSSAFDASGAAAAEQSRAQAAEALLAPLASPALTGTPTVPTAAPATTSTQAASTAYADAAVAVEATARTNADALSELLAHKDQPSGYAGLDSAGLLKLPEVPALPESRVTGLTSDLAARELGLILTAVKTGAYTASPSDYTPWDISTVNGALTLPTAPADRTRVGWKIVAVPGTPGSTTLTVTVGAGDAFNTAGGSTALTYSAKFQAAIAQYDLSSHVWVIQTTDTPLGVALGAAKVGADGLIGTVGQGGTALTASVVNGSQLVVALPAPSGDVTGATDTTVIQGALAACAAAGGGIVRAMAGAVYMVACNSTTTIRQASGNISNNWAYAIAVPAGVILDMAGSTLRAAVGSLGTLICNPTRNVSTYTDHDLGLINAVVDRQNNADNGHCAIELSYITRPVLENVEVINSAYGSVYTYCNYGAHYDNVVADTCQGGGLGLGQPYAGMQEEHANCGELIARNISPWAPNRFNFPGNGVYGVFHNSTIESVIQINCSGGVKWQSVDLVIGRGQIDGGALSTSNSGWKYQQSGGAPCQRVQTGELHVSNQWFTGLYFEGCVDCSVGTYFGYNNGLLGSGGNDLWIGGTRDRVDLAIIDSPMTGGVIIRAYAVDYHLGSVLIRNPNQLRAYSPSTTIAAASNGQTNSATPSTIFVAALPAETPQSGQLTVAGDTVTFTATQASPPAFLGCTGGTHTLATGNVVAIVTSASVAAVSLAGGTGLIDALWCCDEMAAPTGLGAAPVAGGGTFAAGTQFWVVTFTNANGETIASYPTSASVALNGSATLTWAASSDPSWSGTKVYRSVNGVYGAASLVATLGTVTSYSDTGTAPIAGTPPTYNTASRRAMAYGIVYNSTTAQCPVRFLKCYGQTGAAYSFVAGSPMVARNIVVGPPTYATIGLLASGPPIDNLAATTAPTAANDSTQNYGIGSRWVNTVAKTVYTCVDPSAGAAIWQLVPAEPLDNFAATTDPLVTSDTTAGYGVGSRWVNTTTSALFQCASATAGAAAWKRVSSPKVDVFTANGTWAKAAWATKVTVALIGGGGGGGSGRQTATATAASGGSGGGGGAYSLQVFSAAELTATVTVTVGSAGTGGTGQATASTNGNAGTAGGLTAFGSYARVQPGGGAPGGTTGTVAGGAGSLGMTAGAAGGGGTQAAAGGGGLVGSMGAPGGGAGGGLATVPAVLAGGTGGGSVPLNFTAGGAGGTTDGAPGAGGTSVSDLNLPLPGSGGGGGASSIVAAGGAGGAGGSYGAGGGGGGASLNGSASGAGGAGGPGVVVVIAE